MKLPATPLAAVVALLSLCASHARETVLVIGDSLSREYQFEFSEFEEARNWVELLAVHRPDDFYFGPLENSDLGLINTVCDLLDLDNEVCDAIGDDGELERYRYNWAIPTSSAETYAANLTGGSLFQERFQDFINDDFNDVDSVVVFIGGNDIDSVYGPVYNGNVSATNDIIERIEEDLEDVIDFVLNDTPTMRMILVNVPHVGATPEVKGDHPTDPVKTGRVTTALQTLDTNLRALAERKGIGYADVLPLTIDLLDDDPLCVAGFPFINDGNDDGDPEYVWLGGDLSQNFHPNTNGQAIVANSIIAAYNEKYDLGATPFSETEIVEDLIGLETPLSTWAADAGVPAAQRAPESDPDSDGLNNLIEFMLVLDPVSSSSLPSPAISGAEFSYEYQVRTDACFNVIPEFSTDLVNWEDVPPINISALPGDRVQINFTVTEPAQFIRLRIE